MNVAIYPGSFDPITLGHLDIIKRALRVFDKLIIAVGENLEKDPLFSVKERKEMIDEETKNMNVEVDSFSGLLVDYAEKKQCFTLVRSLRAISDFEKEFQMSVTNRKLNEKIDTVFLMTDIEYFYLSSSVVKDVASKKGKISCLVPKNVDDKLKEKFR